MHYHVSDHAPGCLPEDGVYTEDTRRHAESYALLCATEYREERDEDDNPLYRVVGNKRDGYQVTGRGGSAFRRNVSVEVCHDNHCAPVGVDV